MSRDVNPIEEARWRAEARAMRAESRETGAGERTARWRALLPRVGNPDPTTMSAVEVLETTMRLAALDGDWGEASRLAAELAPYKHPKLSSVTQTAADPTAGRTTEDLLEELREIREFDRVADGPARTGDRARAVVATVPDGLGGVGRTGAASVRTATRKTSSATVQRTH